MNNKNIFYSSAIFFITCFFLIGIRYYKSTYEKKIATTFDNSSIEPVLGLYSRSNKNSDIKKNNFQHLVIDITEAANDEEIQRLITNVSSEKLNLITIRTLSYNNNNVLQRIIDGYFDLKIKTICNKLAEIKQPIYLRWNPEMEVPVTLYPWQYQSPNLYIEAFRRFAKIGRESLPEAIIVWGPAGYPGAEEYWPGSDVVDLITISINSKSELQAIGYPVSKDIATSIKRKIHRMRFMDKPILLLGTEDTKVSELAKQSIPIVLKEIQHEQSTIHSTIESDSSFLGSIANKSAKPVVGVYDPKKLLIETDPVKVEHLFINLGDIEDGSFLKEFTAITTRKHDAIVTVEPWRNKSYKQEDNVLLNTVDGKYDSIFKKMFSVLDATNQTVYLRFAHEMEIPIERYPWQSKDPVLYIKAFRHFMKYASPKLKNVKRIWGPAGDRGSVEWWPGSDVVDYISIAIYGLPDKNIVDPAKQELFSTIYARKYHRMRFAHKPIFITEFGVKGPEDLQMRWLEDAANVINQHQEIIGACYFNLADNPKAWGEIPAPDWRINSSTFISFAEKLIAR